MLSRKLSVFILFYAVVIASPLLGQWRISTPRETVTVPANTQLWTISKMIPPASTQLQLTVTGQYTELNGAASFDAGYVMKHPGWSVPPPLRTSPPYKYNGKDYEYGLMYASALGIEQYFVPSEPSFQANHVYTLKIGASGNAPGFKIRAAQGVDYRQATGSLVIKLERWTAGICFKSGDIAFGSVAFGTPLTKLDSIASYGIDPLSIDSIYIDGPQKGNFSFVSERVVKFKLPNELANKIEITFTPQTPGNSNASLFIICKNADPGGQKTEIKLTGFGAQPKIGIITDTVKFGKVRIGPKFVQTKPAYYANTGNSDLEIRGTTYDQAVFTRSSPKIFPVLVKPGSFGNVATTFAPLIRKSYQGELKITGNDNTLTGTVILTGEGAEPIPVFDPPSRIVDFDSVYTGDKRSRPLMITNKGNWPIYVSNAIFGGALKAAFSYTPSDDHFVIEPDSSLSLTFWFTPNTGSERNFQAYLFLYYDNDGSTLDTITLVGKEVTPKTRVRDSVHNFGKVKVGGSNIDTITFVTNTANVPLSFSQSEILPNNQFSLSAPIYNSIGPDSTIQIMGKFAPNVPGPAFAYFYVSANGKKDSVLLLGEGVIAKGIFNPRAADFKIVPTDRADTMRVVLSDSGNLALRVIRYEITGPDKTDFSVTEILQNNVPIQLAPFVPFTINENMGVEFKVRFVTNAKTGAVHTAMLCVYYDDSTSDCLPLEAIEERPVVQFAVPSVDFGKVRVKKEVVKPATFRNGSNITLNIGKVEISGQTDAFSIADSLRPIDKGKMLDFLLKFHPTNIGKYTGEFIASGRDFKQDSIALRGVGADPIVEFSQDTINFNIVKLNTQSTYSPNLIVSNLGNWELNAIKVFIRDDKYREFSYKKIVGGGADNTTLIVEELDSTNAVDGEYEVSFKPTVTTTYHGADLVFLLDDSSEHIVRLVGLDESPNMVLGEDTINLGKVRIGRDTTGTAHLINTSKDILTATNVHLSQTGTEFSATPTGSVVVQPYLPNRQFAIDLGFKPTMRTQIQALLISEGSARITQDTIVLLGTGANPVATFTPDAILDFGDVLYGTSPTGSFNLHNTGNWIFKTIKVDLIGPNVADFIPAVSQIFSIEEDSSRNFNVNFTATTLFQTTDRTATIIFTLDDNSEVRYDFKARDSEPFKTDLRIDNVAARIGDIVYPRLRLVNAVPDSLNVNHFEGTITYDANVVNLMQVDISEALQNTWTLSVPVPLGSTPGSYSYILSSSTDHLSKPVSILKLKFRPHDTDGPGMRSTLAHSAFSYPGRKEVQALLTDGVIVIDSTCGSTHLLSGVGTGTFVDQNHPNPFGNAGSTSDIPFDIGTDDLAVTIRILDMTGREVARPVDNQTFKHGRYSVTVDANHFTSGSYFYEFQAAGMKPEIKKMTIGK